MLNVIIGSGGSIYPLYIIMEMVGLVFPIPLLKILISVYISML